MTKTDILLIINIGIIIIFFIFYLIDRIINRYSKNEKYLNEKRINNINDFSSIIRNQNSEILELKDSINKTIKDLQFSNQDNLFKFLEETKSKLSDLQNNFNKESLEMKNMNSNSINNLINKTSNDLNELKVKILKEINDSNIKNTNNVNNQNSKTQEKIENQIQILKEQVKKSLEEGFLKNEKAMHEFIEKTALIEASTRQMEELKKEINKFNNILSNNKARGNFGESILENIFISIFGYNQIFYQKQIDLKKEFNLKTKEGLKVDFLYNIVTDHGILPLCIDAKFPYNNYLPLLDDNISNEEKNIFKKKFEEDIKQRIKEIEKYIIDGITAPYAIMFIPSEAIFIDIFKEFPSIVEFARSKKIIIASPNLIISIIQILQFILKDYQVRNNADKIIGLIDSIEKDFKIFNNRWIDHKKRIEKLLDDSNDIDISINKLNKNFDKVKNINKK